MAVSDTNYGRMIGTRGLSLVEVLIALAILGLVLALAYGAIIGSVGTQARQEASVTAQAKLRRIVEVLSQDVRSAVFGSLLDQPYATNGNQVSFMLLTGGAGYALDKYLLNQTQVKVIGGTTASLLGRSVLIVNQQGKGQLLRVTGVSAGSGKQTLTLNCSVNVAHTANTLLFEVETLGVSYDDAAEQVNVIAAASAAEAPLAFNINDFRIEYVYSADGRDPIVRTTPNRVLGSISQTLESGGTTYTLKRLQLIIGTDAVTREGTRQYTNTAQIDISAGGDYAIKELTSCI